MDLRRIYDVLIKRGKLRIKAKNDGLHSHRIVPGFQDGEYNIENVTLLTRKEHRIVHHIRYRLFNHVEDKAAYLFLSRKKFTDKELYQLSILGGKIGGKISGNNNKIMKKGICGRTPEKMSEDGRKGGAACKEKNSGIFKLTKKQLQEASKKGNEGRKKCAQENPNYLSQIAKKITKTTKDRRSVDMLFDKKLRESSRKGGITSGKRNVENGHLKSISALGGAAHKGRKKIINNEGKIRRPTLEKAKELVETGEWKFVSEHSPK